MQFNLQHALFVPLPSGDHPSISFNKTLTFHKTFKNVGEVSYGCKTKKEVINMNKNDQNFLVQKIRTQYTETESTGVDELKELDKKVKCPANVFGYLFGGISALIMGAGMSLVMTEIGSVVGISKPMLPGIAIGVAGMLMAILNYPIYKRILASRRKKYAHQIIALSDRIMGK